MKKNEIKKKSQENLLDFDKKMKENVQLLDNYAQNHTRTVYFKGEPIDSYIEVNPIIITNRFFKPIVPFNTNPSYTSEQLGAIYEYYQELLTVINDKIGAFPSSLTLFCRFIGVTLESFKELRNSEDESMRIIVQKIIDDVDEANISMAQTGSAKERTTLFKLKAQNEMVEKTTPKVNVSIKANIDDARVKGNILEYQEFLEKGDN
jgi:hypothetical protein